MNINMLPLNMLSSFVVRVHAEEDKFLYPLHANKFLFQITYNDIIEVVLSQTLIMSIIEVHKISKENVITEKYSVYAANNLIKNPLLSIFFI